MDVPEILSSDHHDRIIRQGVTLIEYYVTWCSPCRVQATVTRRVADDVEGKASIARIDIDRHCPTAKALKIRSVPTLVMFVNGREVRRFVGLQSRDTLIHELIDAIHAHCGPDPRRPEAGAGWA
jgi:thioredoxin 1